MAASDRSDRDILIAVETTVEKMEKQLGRLNEQVDKNKTAIGCLQGCHLAMQVEVKNLKQRPSAFKAVLGVGAFLGLLMTAFKFVS